MAHRIIDVEANSQGSDRRPRRRWLASSPRWLLLLAVADWLLLKSGRLAHPPWVLAILVAAVMVAMMARLVVVVAALAGRRRRWGDGTGELAVLVGVVIALAAGAANWLFSLQGFMVLHEGEAVVLHRGAHLQEFDTGPLARIEEMDVALALREVELEPAGGDSFNPLSRLEVRRGEAPPRIVEIAPGRTAADGSLRFHQGAFGFAPRIVIVRGADTVFDRVVPFTTERRGRDGVSFAGSFTLAAESLRVAGAVDLASLDAGLRGHATLALDVWRNGVLLGRGELLPGHFSELADGFRVGFAGLEKWSEIDLSRRHYGELVLAGAAVAFLGALLWLVAGWRGW